MITYLPRITQGLRQASQGATSNTKLSPVAFPAPERDTVANLGEQHVLLAVVIAQEVIKLFQGKGA
jgi:hypothetical protein